MRLCILYAYYAIYFMSMGPTANFAAIFYEEIGLNNTQIGLLTSLPVLLGMLALPVFGILSDNARRRRNVIALVLALCAGFSFLYDLTDRFALLMVICTGTALFSQPVLPLSSSLSMEYTSSVGRSFGPIRMAGSVGFQVSALLAGVVFTTSMRGLYRMIGVFQLLAAGLALLLPPIAGHQRERGVRVSPVTLLRDRRVLLLLLMVFPGTIMSMFYQSFFTKHFASCGASNAMVGLMSVLSVGLELPFLLFSGRLYRKLTVWQWLLLGMAVNAVRWIGVALTQNVMALLALQLLGVSVLACFEYFPALYLSERVAPELLSSAQTTLNFVSFGIARVVGCLLGGALGDVIGVSAVFGLGGLMLAIGLVAFFAPARRMSALDRQTSGTTPAAE